MASHARIARPCLLGFAVALALAAAGTAAARSSGACRDDACTARIVVGPGMAWFESAEVFHPGSERVSVHLTVGDGQLSVVERTGVGACRRRLSGEGVRAVVNVCGAHSPVRVRARRVWGGWVNLGVSYRAIRRATVPQGVKGVHAGAGHSAGGVGTPGSGGITAPRP